ncbi:hypothetical protein V1520DRAFT_377466 [Lipomyces starkeyi]
MSSSKLSSTQQYFQKMHKLHTLTLKMIATSMYKVLRAVESKLSYMGFTESGIEGSLSAGAHGLTGGLSIDVTTRKDRVSTFSSGVVASIAASDIYLRPDKFEFSKKCQRFLEKLETSAQTKVNNQSNDDSAEVMELKDCNGVTEEDFKGFFEDFGESLQRSDIWINVQLTLKRKRL